jgi:hypothetical protein
MKRHTPSRWFTAPAALLVCIAVVASAFPSVMGVCGCVGCTGDVSCSAANEPAPEPRSCCDAEGEAAPAPDHSTCPCHLSAAGDDDPGTLNSVAELRPHESRLDVLVSPAALPAFAPHFAPSKDRPPPGLLALVPEGGSLNIQHCVSRI